MPETMPQVTPLVVLVLLGVGGSIIGVWIWAILRIAFRLPVLPPNTPRVVPWGPGSVLVALLIWVATQVAVPVAYRAAVGGGAVKPDGGNAAAAVVAAPGPGLLMTFSALSNAATLILVPLVLAATSGATRRDFGVGLSGLGRQLGRGVLAYPLLAPVVFGVMLTCVAIWRDRTEHPLEKALKLDASPGMAAILFLAAVVLAPAAEELIFRGVLLGWLTRLALGTRAPSRVSPTADDPEAAFAGPPRPDLIFPEPDAEVTFFDPTGPRPKSDGGGPDPGSTPTPAGRSLRLLAAKVVVSLVFGALHGAVWPTPIPIFFLSLGLGLLYQRTGSLLAPIALHMTFNGVSTAILFLALGARPAAPAPMVPPAPIPVPGPARAAAAPPVVAIRPSADDPATPPRKMGTTSPFWLTPRRDADNFSSPSMRKT